MTKTQILLSIGFTKGNSNVAGDSEKRKKNFPTIREDALVLGVHRVSLYRVLTGRRQNPELLERYARLCRRKAELFEKLIREFSK